MDETLYWIWLQSVLGPGNSKVFEAARQFGSPRGLYETPEHERWLSGLFTVREIGAMADTPLDAAANIADQCTRLGYQILTPSHTEYPRRLRNIYAPPAVLYVCGTLEQIDDQVAIAVVGARNATQYGHRAAFLLSTELAKAGAIIVSGGAMGIDSDAHTGALRAGGRTVCVLGCGINYRYLMKNATLREAVSHNGALVSEYPPNTSAGVATFPMRNRLIAGLSLGVVVIEAGEKSGSLITAARAVEQGRDVFAVPGSVLSSSYAGTNRLLRDGAKPVFSAMDVLEEYAGLYPHRLNLKTAQTPIFRVADGSDGSDDMGQSRAANQVSPLRDKPVRQPAAFEKRPPPKGLSPDAQRVFSAFCEFVMSTDRLISVSGLETARAMAALTELELAGVAEGCSGGRYGLIQSEAVLVE